MGRKQSAQLTLDIPEELPIEAEPEPEPERPAAAPRRARARTPESRPGWRTKARRVVLVLGIVLGMLAAVAAGYQADQFLASDPHFLLAPDGLAIDGLAHAARPEVARVFAGDIGRSVYLIPLAERRNRLMTVDWVRDATLLRRWPNRVTVHVVERTPIAFVVLPNPAGWANSEVALIDADGVILKPPARAKFSLPALVGISRRDRVETRRARVQQAAALIREVQSYAAQISEIDVSDPENLSVTEVAEGRALRLRLGNRNYLARLSNFLSHYPDIARRLPYARTFDLRLDNHITAQDGGPDGR